MRPSEDVKAELVGQWLSKAASDLGVAQHLLSAHTPYLDAIGFHAQQAAEKYLKAFLVQHQVEFPRTHDLGELLDLVAGVHAPLASSLRGAIALNPYGVDSRYPGYSGEIRTEDAREAVALATHVHDAILQALEGSV
jgi:HEPN domain-containing protein